MSTASKSLHSSVVPVLEWAHKNDSSPPHQSNPSSQPEDPNQEAAQQEPQAVAAHNKKAVDPSPQPRNLRPRKPRTPPKGDVGGSHKNVRIVVKKKEKLCVSLTEEEIEEDLYAMTGEVATRRPKRRPKAVQKELDKLFPGLCLDGTSADTYRAT